MIKVSDLDKRICDIEADTNNTETYREFIRNSELDFGIEHEDLDSMNDEKLNDYLDLLDGLWLR